MKYSEIKNNPFSDYRPTEISEAIESERKNDALSFYKTHQRSFSERSCPSCGSSKANPLEKYINIYPIAQCTHCSLIYVAIAPDNLALLDYYKNSKSIKLLNKFYESRKKDNLVHSKRFDLLKKYTPINKNTGNILEIGCGKGTLLEEISNDEDLKNFEIFGIEPNSDELKKIGDKKIHIYNEMFDIENPNKYGKYDFILCFELIEHLPKPREFFKSIYSIMNKDGLLILSTPNIEGFGNILSSYNNYRLTAHPITPPMHLQGFSRISLALLANNSKFSIEEIDATGAFDAYEFIKYRENNLLNNTMTEAFDSIYSQANDWSKISSGLQKIINSCNSSSSMYAIFRKAQ